MMEDYFDQDTDKKLADARPELGYQIGVTPEKVEVPRCGKDAKCVNMVQQVRFHCPLILNAKG